jgi:endonuclease/exonuclease/phosphatase family metal-dependent hydrolase
MSDQLFWLSRRLGMRAQFGSNIGDLWGNAVLTNFVARSEGHHFENPGRVPRGVLDTLTLFGGSGLRVLVTHLDHEDDGPQTRLDQIDTLLDIWGGDPQTLVLGDFNAEPDSMEYRRLIDAGLRDLLSESGNPSPTRPSDDPVTRIDYAFASPGLELERASTPKSLASDHLPILVELRIP